MNDKIELSEIQDEPIKETKKIKDVEKPKIEKIAVPVSGLVSFIKDGVTIIRDISLSGMLIDRGWERK